MYIILFINVTNGHCPSNSQLKLNLQVYMTYYNVVEIRRLFSRPLAEVATLKQMFFYVNWHKIRKGPKVAKLKYDVDSVIVTYSLSKRGIIYT